MGKVGEKFFKEFTNEGEVKKQAVRGRSPELLQVRNEKIFHRFYYYSRIIQYKYEHVLTALKNDFDLSENTIAELIMNNANRVKEVGDLKLTRKQLKDMFPNYSWDIKEVELPQKEREVFVLK